MKCYQEWRADGYVRAVEQFTTHATTPGSPTTQDTRAGKRRPQRIANPPSCNIVQLQPSEALQKRFALTLEYP